MGEVYVSGRGPARDQSEIALAAASSVGSERIKADDLVAGCHPDRVRCDRDPAHTAQLGQRERRPPPSGAAVHPRQQLVEVGHHIGPLGPGGQVPGRRGGHDQG
jgi:hypothetical protein